MLRIIGKTTVLAAALYAIVSFGPLSARTAAAQEAQGGQSCGCQTCQAGHANHGCKKCGAGRGRGRGASQCGNCRTQQHGQPELFHNYYVPGTCGGVPASMYLAPLPVPAAVGHTYYTYQPFMPHEMLYQHSRNYYRYYNGGRGLTRTHVSWSRPLFTR